MNKLFGAIGRIFMAIITLGQYKANRVADNMYTKSEDGVRAGYAELRDQLIEQFEQVVSGVSGIESIKSEKESQLENLNKEEISLQNTLEGIITAVEQNPNDKQAVKDFNRLDARQDAIDIEQEKLIVEIGEMEASLEDKQMMLNKIKDEITDLKREEEESVSDMALASLEAKLAQEEMGLKKSIDRSGVDAIRDSISKKRAIAKTLSRASGADTEKRMQKYKSKGQASQSSAKLQEILAKRAEVKQVASASGGSKIKANTARKI
jgi:hypothetical protein